MPWNKIIKQESEVQYAERRAAVLVWTCVSIFTVTEYMCQSSRSELQNKTLLQYVHVSFVLDI